jgi:outer membrane usher protein
MPISNGNQGIKPLSRIFLNLALVIATLANVDPAGAAEQPLTELVLEVRVNQQDLEEMLVLLRDGEGNFWLDERDFERLRLQMPTGPSLEQGDRRYYSLNAIPGATTQFNEALAMLIVDVPARAFLAQKIAATQHVVGSPMSAATGLFLNYQVSGQRVGSDSNAGALTELGLFSRLGVVTNTMATRHVPTVTKNTRLDTTLSYDFTDRLQTLTLGDAITDAGAWGTALRFAGVRFSRNFGIRPDLITTPLLTTNGSAVVPSSVDVFVNNQQVLSQQVQPGPFTIESLPAVTGFGDVRIVVRDALGREQILTQSFYSSPTLLAKGLNQYSFALGKVRENYTISSFEYGGLTASANWRRGVSDYLTIEGHAEYLQDQAHAAGVDASFRLGSLGIVSATLAGGGDSNTTGWLGGLGFERRGLRSSFALSGSYAANGFRRAGDLYSSTIPANFRVIAQAGVNLGKAGNVSLAIAHRTFRDLPAARTIGLSHNIRVGKAGSVNFSLNRTTGVELSTTGFLTYSTAWGLRRSFETSAEVGDQSGNGRDKLRASLSQTAPVGKGSGWRLGATQGGNYDAVWQQHLAAVDVEVQAARNFSRSGQSVQVRGSAILLGGRLSATRAIDGSFAMVDVGGIANVPVYLENQLVTHTDSQGRALLHNLLSYEPNRISIAPEDLPLDTSIGSRTLTIQPAYRSGLVAKFPVERVSPATFRLVQSDGRPVPSGAQVSLNGGDFTVALDGLTYVTTLDHGVGGTATWDTGRCTFRVGPPPSDDPLPDMGAIPCRAQTPVTP